MREKYLSPETCPRKRQKRSIEISSTAYHIIIIIRTLHPVVSDVRVYINPIAAER